MASPDPEPEKRCHYEVLGLRSDCSADEIRSAYKKLALQRHPDKLAASGVSPAAATAAFQELVNSYQVLSDPHQRSLYDSSCPNPSYSFNCPKPSNSFNFPSCSVPGNDFYAVHSELFDKIYSNELNFVKSLGLGLGLVSEAPAMGNSESPYSEVTAFYGYWLGFLTVIDFSDAVSAGPNRRAMEEEKKRRRKEYNATVRWLTVNVKKRDPRVIDMEMRRREERERRRVERERMRKEREKIFQEKREEFCCVICGNYKFQSEKQWKNHERSKKHKEKVAELKEAERVREKAQERLYRKRLQEQRTGSRASVHVHVRVHA
ncbi:DNAJ heat shock N-terminal domain-containing protein [Actinidia rufa]|uniref:DNAJ heat shock N-terminal domain-containing protein n=1 Tax=Actinidia rufa TaxID=165716 RepID=A0A7J0ESW7_9ERIC|nr:DNAJ heat shock N-terminal domain-containing protein [Actinidia rufa]